MDAEVGFIASLAPNLVLSEPVISALVKQDAAPVGIYVNTVIVAPEPARNEPSTFILLGGTLSRNRLTYCGGTKYQIRQFFHILCHSWGHIMSIHTECQVADIAVGGGLEKYKYC